MVIRLVLIAPDSMYTPEIWFMAAGMSVGLNRSKVWVDIFDDKVIPVAFLGRASWVKIISSNWVMESLGVSCAKN